MNKKYLGLFAVIVLCAIAFAQAPNVLVYLEQGGAKQVIASGGEIEVRSGGTLDIQSGATFTQAGTITQTGAVNQDSKLDILSGGEVEISSGATFEFVSGGTWTVADGTIPRADLTEDVLQPYDLHYSTWSSTADAEPLVTAFAADKFSLSGVGSGPLGIAGKVAVEGVNTTESPTMVTTFRLPAEYVAAGDVSVVVTAKVTNVADVKTIDVIVNETDFIAGTLGADICATAIQNLTTSFVDYTFSVTATNLVAGDGLTITVNGVVTDAAGGTTTGIQITGIKVLCDIKG